MVYTEPSIFLASRSLFEQLENLRSSTHNSRISELRGTIYSEAIFHPSCFYLRWFFSSTEPTAWIASWPSVKWAFCPSPLIGLYIHQAFICHRIATWYFLGALPSTLANAMRFLLEISVGCGIAWTVLCRCCDIRNISKTTISTDA